MRKGVPASLMLAAVLLVFATGMAPQQDMFLSEGSDAPAFELEATDGETYALEEVSKKATVFLVFWKGSCPSNTRAAPLIESMKKAYGDKVKLLGIVSASAEGTKSWIDRYGANYPLMADPDLSLTKEYGLVRSICTFQVDTDGKIVKVFPGFGYDALNSLNQAMAEVAGVDVAEVDLSGAPSRATWG